VFFVSVHSCNSKTYISLCNLQSAVSSMHFSESGGTMAVTAVAGMYTVLY
jgi:hypothetical protein